MGWIQLSRPITHGPQVAKVLLNLPDLYRLCYYPPLYGSMAQVAKVLLNLLDLYQLCYYPPLYGSK